MTAAPDLTLRQVPLASIERADWDRLLALTPAATPFARWTFHRAWWDAYGDAAVEQYLIATDADSDSPRAIVPLMRRSAPESEREAIYFGASYHADYATILGAAADMQGVADGLANVLQRWSETIPGDQAWSALDLRRLRPADPALVALDTSLNRPTSRWPLSRTIEDVCPVVTVPGSDWDEYLAMLHKKHRHEIRRKIRRAAAIGEVSIDVAAPTQDAIDGFIALHNARFGEDGLFPNSQDGERSRYFVHRLAELERAEADSGQLHVGLVRCGERLVFAMLAFDDGHTCYLYNSGMDPAAAEASPGVTGTAAYLKDRMAAGRRRFDYLRGAESYKYQWGAQDEPIERLLVVRSDES